MYVFDTSPLTTLFKNYYPARFPSLWEKFDALVDGGEIVSAKEVLRELADGPVEAARLWAADHPSIFHPPTAAEAAFIGKIYNVSHFQHNIEQQKLLKGGRNADPFVISKAAIEGRAVVSMEQFKANSAKIPNICKHFGVSCLSLEEFMENEGWIF